MPERTWDRFAIGVCDYVLEEVKAGNIPPEQGCLGSFSYDYRTRTGVVMLLDVDSLPLLKDIVSQIALQYRSNEPYTFEAIGAFDLNRQPVYARVDRLPFKFDLSDPGTAHEYLDRIAPFIRPLPFALTRHDFELGPDPFIREDTRVLLEIFATPQLVEYIKYYKGKVPFPVAVLPFDRIRPTRYMRALAGRPQPRPNLGPGRSLGPRPTVPVPEVPSPPEPQPDLWRHEPKDVLRTISPGKSSVFKNFSVRPSRNRPDLLHSIYLMLSSKVVVPPQDSASWKRAPADKKPLSDSRIKPG